MMDNIIKTIFKIIQKIWIYCLFLITYFFLYFIDFLYVYSVFLLIYEFIVIGLSYVYIFIRSCFPYLMVFLGFYLLHYILNYIFYKEGSWILRNKYEIKTAYLNFYFKEYNNVIILYINLFIFFIIYYFEFYYRSIDILIIISFYLFIFLGVYIKKVLKQKDIINIKFIKIWVNILLAIIISVCIILINDSINEYINFKINISNYVYNIALRKDRLFLLLKVDKSGNWFKMFHNFKIIKRNEYYLHVKNKILNNNILNDFYYKSYKYNRFNSKSQYYILRNYYSKLMNSNRFIIYKEKPKLLNFVKNDLSVNVNNKAVWYDVFKSEYKYNDFFFKKKTRGSLNWRLHLYHLYDYNWSNFMPTEKKLKSLNEILLKKPVKLEITNNIKKALLLHNKKAKILFQSNNKGLTPILLYNKKIILHNLFYSNAADTEDINQVFNLKSSSSHLYKFNNLYDILNYLIAFKKKITSINLEDLIYNAGLQYNYLLSWWEKKFYIAHKAFLRHRWNSYSFMKQYKSKHLKNIGAEWEWEFNKKKNKFIKKINLKNKVIKLNKPKGFMKFFLKTLDRKSLYLDKPYLKYPKTIFKSNKLFFNKNFNTKSHLVLYGFFKQYKGESNSIMEWLQRYLSKDTNTKKFNNVLVYLKKDDPLLVVFCGEQKGEICAISGNINYDIKLKDYLYYYKRAVVYNKLLFKFNSINWFKYITFMHLKYFKFLEWCSITNSYNNNSTEAKNADYNNYIKSFNNKDYLDFNSDNKNFYIINKTSNKNYHLLKQWNEQWWNNWVNDKLKNKDVNYWTQFKFDLLKNKYLDYNVLLKAHKNIINNSPINKNTFVLFNNKHIIQLILDYNFLLEGLKKHKVVKSISVLMDNIIIDHKKKMLKEWELKYLNELWSDIDDTVWYELNTLNMEEEWLIEDYTDELKAWKKVGETMFKSESAYWQEVMSIRDGIDKGKIKTPIVFEEGYDVPPSIKKCVEDAQRFSKDKIINNFLDVTVQRYLYSDFLKMEFLQYEYKLKEKEIELLELFYEEMIGEEMQNAIAVRKMLAAKYVNESMYSLEDLALKYKKYEYEFKLMEDYSPYTVKKFYYISNFLKTNNWNNYNYSRYKNEFFYDFKKQKFK